MTVTNEHEEQEDFVRFFCEWADRQIEMATKIGVPGLAARLRERRAACAMGLLDDDECVNYMKAIAETPLPLLDQEFLQRLIAGARAEAVKIPDATARTLDEFARKPPTTKQAMTRLAVARATDDQYRREFDRFRWQSRMPTDGTRKSQTVRTRRAAVRVSLKRLIERSISVLEQPDRVTSEAEHEAAGSLLWAIEALEKLDQPPLNAGASPPAPIALPASESASFARTHTKGCKRHGMGPFGIGAEDKFFCAVLACGLLKEACAVIVVFGLRPCEVARGVRLRRLGDVIVVRAVGGKLTDKNGQPFRSIAIRAENMAAKYLLERLNTGSGSLVVGAPSAKRVCDTMARAGKRAFPRSQHPPTAYNFRHEMATDLKIRRNPEETAKGMGQRSASTQGGYGTHRRSRRGGRNTIVRVRAPLPIRALERVRPRPAVAKHPAGIKPRKP